MIDGGQINVVHDWVILSLSNFTQRTPLAMAIWSLICFFISASVNPWLRAVYPLLLANTFRVLLCYEYQRACVHVAETWM